MPGNRKITKKTIKGKDGLHPGSRKAGQLTRVHLRTAKLQQAAKHRKDAYSTKLQKPLFFLHALTSPLPLSLASLKALTQLYIERNDVRISELEGERRPGRPKAKELLELEERRRSEEKEYETGMEVPDLTHPHTTKLLYSFVEDHNAALSTSHVDLLRHVRVFRNSQEVVLSRAGKTANMGLGDETVHELGDDWSASAPTAGAGDGGEIAMIS